MPAPHAITPLVAGLWLLNVLVDTGGQLVGRAPVEPGTAITLESRSLVVLREHRERPVGADRTVAPAL